MIIGAMNNPKKGICSEILLFGELCFDYVDLLLLPPYTAPERVLGMAAEIENALKSYNFGVVAKYKHRSSKNQSSKKKLQEAFYCAAFIGARKISIEPKIKGFGALEAKDEAGSAGLELFFDNSGFSPSSLEEAKEAAENAGSKIALNVDFALAGSSRLLQFYSQNKNRIGHVRFFDSGGALDSALCKADAFIARLKRDYDGTITVCSEKKRRLMVLKERLEIAFFGKERFLENMGYLMPKKPFSKSERRYF